MRTVVWFQFLILPWKATKIISKIFQNNYKRHSSFKLPKILHVDQIKNKVHKSGGNGALASKMTRDTTGDKSFSLKFSGFHWDSLGFYWDSLGFYWDSSGFS